MYSLSAYGVMLADSIRMSAYEAALRASIGPGAVVVDIGAGTGVMSLLACQMGAAHVYAIEPNSAIEVARAIAQANGCADRITFIQDSSTRVTLPQPADVIVADLRGVLPLYGQHLPSLIDARSRLLRPGGVLIPQRDILRAAVVHAPEAYARVVGSFDGSPFGLDMTAARGITVNTWAKARIKSEQMLCPPQTWATLSYMSIEQADVRGSLGWTAEQSGEAHGLYVWFDAELAAGIGFSNQPGLPELIYGGAFMPWEQPVRLAAGDQVEVRLAADLVGDDYIWRWQTRVRAADGAHKAAFQQSTFFGVPLPAAALHRRSPAFVPRLSDDGQVDRFILHHMDGSRSLLALARLVVEQFPARFSGEQAALSYVADLAATYSA
jgi:protein arginine N-methyltransferase 1